MEKRAHVMLFLYFNLTTTIREGIAKELVVLLN